MWISDAIDTDRIQPSQAAHHSGGPQAATDWIKSNYHHIPEHLRPALSELGEFASFFSTFLTSSFDVVADPRTKGEGYVSPFSCRCQLCLRIVSAPHLRTKKLFARDKRRANFLMVESMLQLATEYGLELNESQATQLALNDATRRHAAYVSYGQWLIRRLDGESDGPAVLALWRLVAWDPRGGLRPRFKLKLDQFERAEKHILIMIQYQN